MGCAAGRGGLYGILPLHATWQRCRAAWVNGSGNYRTRLLSDGVVSHEVVVDTWQISAAYSLAGRYAVWMGLYSLATQIRVSVDAGIGADSEDPARLLEIQLEP